MNSCYSFPVYPWVVFMGETGCISAGVSWPSNKCGNLGALLLREWEAVCVRVQNAIFSGSENVLLYQFSHYFPLLLRCQYYCAFGIKNPWVGHQSSTQRLLVWLLWSPNLWIIVLFTLSFLKHLFPLSLKWFVKIMPFGGVMFPELGGCCFYLVVVEIEETVSIGNQTLRQGIKW